jgi:hypothetical protein
MYFDIVLSNVPFCTPSTYSRSAEDHSSLPSPKQHVKMNLYIFNYPHHLYVHDKTPDGPFLPDRVRHRRVQGSVGPPPPMWGRRVKGAANIETGV